jgi:hypothetical protein
MAAGQYPAISAWVKVIVMSFQASYFSGGNWNGLHMRTARLAEFHGGAEIGIGTGPPDRQVRAGLPLNRPG